VIAVSGSGTSACPAAGQGDIKIFVVQVDLEAGHEGMVEEVGPPQFHHAVRGQAARQHVKCVAQSERCAGHDGVRQCGCSESEVIDGARGDVPPDDDRGSRGRGRGVQDVDDAVGFLDQEVVDERPRTAKALGADPGRPERDVP
jgi:hypothetical protein